MSIKETPIVKGIAHSDEKTQAGEIKNYYKLHAKIYDLTRWSFLFGRREILQRLPIERSKSITILEVGCGTGFNLKLLGKQFPNAKLIGIDVSHEMLEKAKENTAAFKDRVTLVEAPYSRDSKAAGSGVDIVLCSYSLTMINPQWQEVILKAKADLKVGGYMAVTDFHQSQFSWFERHMGNNHVRMNGHLLPFLESH
ncbi:MAG: class I SAM-dependent methyltransferase, partial [Saprospiraceae bacterium]|nr:class I SAM-dependent methyltransferase [Saprospiraceae bacterium]